MPDEPISIDSDLLKTWKSAPRRANYDADTALDLISQHESGGRNIKQNVVPAGGGYNPSVGKVTGPSSAQGPWQITNSTWGKRAPREIVQKYPTAMSAPVEVQREVARKMYQETGFQDWAPYNASLRKAISRGDQPRTRVRQPQQSAQQPEIDPELLNVWKGEQPVQPPPQVAQKAPAQPAQEGSWASNLYNQKPQKPVSQFGRIRSGVQGERGVRGIGGARIAGESKPSESTVARGALRNIAQMGGLPTQIPTQAGDFINQGVAEGTTGLMQRGAGFALQAPGLPMGAGAPVAERLRKGAGEISQASQAIDKDTIRSGVNVPVLGRMTTKDVQNVGSGAIASAPALALQRLGVPAPIAFGLDSYLASTGRGDELTTALKEAGLGAATGGLYEIPLPRAAKATMLRQIGAKLGLGAAGGYGLAKAFGVPEEEARKNAAVTALFMASGVRKEPSALNRGLDREIAREGIRNARPTEVPESVGRVPTEASIVTEGTTPAVAERAPKLEQVPDVAQTTKAPQVTPAQEEIIRPPMKSAESPVNPARAVETSPAATTPEMKPSKLAQGVEAKAVEAKLTEGFKDLPEYQTVKVADQAQKATELLNSDPELARRIAMGTEQPPSGLLPESVFTAVENRALERGDVDTIRDLATQSTRSMEATGMGQRIRMLGERNPNSPVAAIQKVELARSARVPKSKVAKVRNDIQTEVNVEMKKAAPREHAWSDFLESIKC